MWVVVSQTLGTFFSILFSSTAVLPPLPDSIDSVFMASEQANRAKSEGTAAYSRGDYQTATNLFTTAVEHGAGDKEFLKIIHSNRSAAYFNMKQYEKALSDGNKCVELDAQWSKGYGRKGDALYALRRFGEAYNAYNAALRIAPADQAMKEKAEKAMAAIRNESSSAGSSASTSSASDDSVVVKYLKYATLGLFFTYLIPLGGMVNSWSYRLSAGAFAIEQIIGVYKRHGFPRLAEDYAARLMPDSALPRLLLGFFVAMSPRPYLLALIPILLMTIASFTQNIFQYGRDNARAIEEKVMPMLRQYVPAAQAQALGLDRLNVAALLDNRMAAQFQVILQRLAAQGEVSQGIFLVVELLLPTRNFLQLYLWWQYLKMRYMQEQAQTNAQQRYCQQAFVEMDRTISGLLAHRLCPEILRKGYGMISAYLAKQVVLPTREQAEQQRAGGAGGFLSQAMSRCNIM